MTTYLINHLRIPNGVPKPEGLDYLERVEANLRTENVISDLIPVDAVSAEFTSAEWAREIRGVVAAGASAD